MAAVVGARSGLPSYFSGAETRTNPIIVSFEKELGYFTSLIRRAEKRPQATDFRQKAPIARGGRVWTHCDKRVVPTYAKILAWPIRSNTLFTLWNNYAGRLASSYFTEQLLATGDVLYLAGEYEMARTHCYGRYLSSVGLRDDSDILEYLSKLTDIDLTVPILRALIRGAMCQYYLTEKEDPKLMRPSTRATVISVLERLQHSTQLSLQREPHYWLVYNAVFLTYTICRRAMAFGLSSQMVEYLIWAGVCMESSVPLMAVKYLQLRVNLYVAVCQCYYDMRQPLQAELFARRGLDKVHELAQLEHHSSSKATEGVEVVFREASIKLGIMVFKRSVLESRKKTKSVFRKLRPTVKDLLQTPSPRSQTERLLQEMFPGQAAQFLAILESVTDGSSRRPLEQAPPHPITELDQDTVNDVYQELFCAGVDLVQRALDQLQEGDTAVQTGSLMASASRGEDAIPLTAMVQFVRLCHVYEQREVFEMIVGRVLQATKSSEDPVARSKGRTLELLLAVESLLSTHKRPKTTDEGKAAEGSPQEPFDQVCHLLRELHAACQDPVLLSSEYDLLVDSALLLWETARPPFARVHSHEFSMCKHLLSYEMGLQYLGILKDVVEVFHALELWRIDPLLHGEVCLKLGCLYEAKAELRQAVKPLGPTGEATFIVHDRSQLLECLDVMHTGMTCVTQARRAQYHDHSDAHTTRQVKDLEVLHAEFLFAITRVKLKLASTIPQPPPGEGTHKPSSLKAKVKERREREELQDRMLSELTAPDVPVAEASSLLVECGRDRYSAALLMMLQAAVSLRLDQGRREALMKEAFTHLTELAQEQPRSQATPTRHTSSPPAPILLHVTDTSMVLKPAPFTPTTDQEMAYYKLYGRPSSGSNVRVRLADKNLSGLGVEVPAERNCILEVHGLQPNEEYVFAVAAYTSSGELVGKTIGQTGRPIVASFSLPLLAAWGYCCQCAYVSGAYSVAKRAASVLWNHFVSEEEQNQDEHVQLYRLKTPVLSSTPPAILRQFVQSVFIHVQVAIVEGSLLPDQLCVAGPPRSSQASRMELTERLLATLEVSGMLNDASLCLQTVVMCYGLLAHFLQHNITAEPLTQALLHCHAALAEIPESLLVHKHSSTTASLHHMIATTAFQTGKALLSSHRKALFSLLTDGVRGLLLATVPSQAGTKQKEVFMGGSGLHHASLSSAVPDPSVSSHTTMSSIPGLLGQKVAGGHRKKKMRRKASERETLPDLPKGGEYKAFEAFLMTNQSQSVLEEIDLTGQEDPVILHAVIATMPSQTAYKEVYKFRKRPQYLEFFVHLASVTVAKGHPDRVIEWGEEAFAWLARRNELVLSSKPTQTVRAPPKGAGGEHGKHSQTLVKTRPPPKSNGAQSTALVPVKRADSSAVVKAKGGGLGDAVKRADSSAVVKAKGGGLGDSVKRADSSAVVKAKGGGLGDSVKRADSSAVVKGKGGGFGDSVKRADSLAVVKAKGGGLGDSVNRSRLVPRGRTSVVKRGEKSHSPSLALAELTITRDDLETKACAVLQTLLPEMWKTHKSRKRLRAVCSEELPWRAQANVLLGISRLDVLLGRLQKTAGEKECSIPSEWLRFETTGVMIDGVIPVYSEALPGDVHKTSDSVPKEPGVDEATDLGEPPPTLLQELQQMLKHYQRAVVLAHRGRGWILLQNTCKSLWNAMTTLVSTLQPCVAEDADGGVTLAAVYGLSCKPLYFAASALTDLILHCGMYSSQDKFPVASSLWFTPALDECSAVDLGFTRKMVFLALHDLHTHQHWEKVVDIATTFDDATNHSWAEQLVPVITSAQENLANRVLTHRRTLTRDVLEPAAHLDPGPEGHNIYGGVGHSLALSSVPLDTQATLQRLEGEGGKGGERTLLHCRRLMVAYLAGANRHDVVEGSPQPPSSTHLSPSHPHTVISAYDSAIKELLAGKQKGLAAQAMHELGNLLYHSNSHKLAAQWWSMALQTIFQTKDPLNSWRKLTAARSDAKHPFLEKFGMWGCLLAGILASKMAKYVYKNELDIQLEYTLMAAALFKALPTSSLPHPLSDMAYATYPPEAQLVPGVELFGDLFRCDPTTLLSCLQFCAQELVSRKHAVKALPVLWLYQYIAHKVCRDIQHTVLAKILRVQTMTRLSLFAECLSLLVEILNGAALPQSCSEYNRPPDSHGGSVKFNNDLPLDDPKNYKALIKVLEKSLSSSLASVYGEVAVAQLALARAQLYTTIAATCTAVPQQSLMSTNRGKDQGLTKPITTLSSGSAAHAPSAPSSASSVRSGSSVPSSRPPRNKLSLTPDNMKLLLLDHSERQLIALCQNLSDKDSFSSLKLRVRAYLELTEVALTLHHSSTAVQLSLAAVRMLQYCVDRSRKSINGSLLDTRLWLECRAMLARSLVGTQLETEGGGKLLDCSQQCEEGLKECDACGEVEMGAMLHYTAAIHALAGDIPKLEQVTSHAQSVLHLLESLAELSPSGRLLRCQASLLLGEASCVQQDETRAEMVAVFQGIGKLLKEQMQEESLGGQAVNIYKPQIPLLVSTQLRLSHTLTLLASQCTDMVQRSDLIDQALKVCRDGMDALEESTHGDTCVMAELMFHQAWLQTTKRTSVTDSDEQRDNSLFLETSRTVAECGVDYRLAFTCYSELAEALALSSKQPHLLQFPETHSPERMRRRSRRSSWAPSMMSRDLERIDKAEKEWVRARAREAYSAWCLVKTAYQALTAGHNIQLLTAELHNEDVVKVLSEKVLAEMPDFALLELCQSRSILGTLATTLEEIPPEVLLPSAQSTSSAGLNWFKVIVYTNLLLQRCFWQKSLLPSSDWSLHYNMLTPSVYPKCKAMIAFLSNHYQPFSASCKVPFPLSTLMSIPAKTSTPATPSVIPQSTGPSSTDAYHTAGNTELTVIWYQPFLPSLKGTTIQPNDSTITGLFALNFKAVRSHPLSNFGAAEIEVHVVKTSVSALTELHTTWEELAVLAKTYLDTRGGAVRPVSRSPSRQKRITERSQKTPPELQNKLVLGMQKLCETFGFELSEEQLPKLEPHSVAGISNVLRPFTHTVVKGDVYQFFQTLFNI